MATYEYSGGMSMGRPKTIADTMREREEMERAQGAMWAQGEADYVADARARRNAVLAERDKMFLEGERNRLGLSPLANQLNDPYSAAYETVDAKGNRPEPFIDLEVGGLDGSAPAPIPTKRSSAFGLGLHRQVKPQFQEAAAAQRTEDSVNTRPASAYDNPLRQDEARTKKLDTLYGIYNNMSTVDKRSPQGQSIMDEIQTTLRGGLQPEPTPAPTTPEVKTGGVDTLEVAPAGGAVSGGLSPEDRATVEANKKAFPKANEAQIIQLLRQKGMISG